MQGQGRGRGTRRCAPSYPGQKPAPRGPLRPWPLGRGQQLGPLAADAPGKGPRLGREKALSWPQRAEGQRPGGHQMGQTLHSALGRGPKSAWPPPTRLAVATPRTDHGRKGVLGGGVAGKHKLPEIRFAPAPSPAGRQTGRRWGVWPAEPRGCQQVRTGQHRDPSGGEGGPGLGAAARGRLWSD